MRNILFILAFLITLCYVNLFSWNEEQISGTSVGKTFTTQVTVSSNLIVKGDIQASTITPSLGLRINGNLLLPNSGYYIAMYDTVASTQGYILRVTNGVLTLTKN